MNKKQDGKKLAIVKQTICLLTPTDNVPGWDTKPTVATGTGGTQSTVFTCIYEG